MKGTKIYVTFKYKSITHQNYIPFAVECDTKEQVCEVAMYFNSYACFKNIRMNRCGRFVKNTQMLNYSNYNKATI